MFNLTPQERRVILFLVSVALLGLVVNLLAKIYSPTKTTAGFVRDIGKMNLNAADKDSLMGVPGIGEKIAGRIIEYRQSRGSFSTIEELRSVKGITEYRYGKIKGYFILK